MRRKITLLLVSVTATCLLALGVFLYVSRNYSFWLDSFYRGKKGELTKTEMPSATSGMDNIKQYISSIGPSSDPSMEVTWNYSNSRIFAYIIDKDLTRGTLKLWVYIPENEAFSKKEIDVRINCTSKDSAVVTPSNMDIVKTDISVLEEAVPLEDGITTYCLDGSCTLIGKSCAILQNLYGASREIYGNK